MLSSTPSTTSGPRSRNRGSARGVRQPAGSPTARRASVFAIGLIGMGLIGMGLIGMGLIGMGLIGMGQRRRKVA